MTNHASRITQPARLQQPLTPRLRRSRGYAGQERLQRGRPALMRHRRGRDYGTEKNDAEKRRRGDTVKRRRKGREDVKEKFDTVIEGYDLLSGKIDRLAKQNEAEY